MDDRLFSDEIKMIEIRIREIGRMIEENLGVNVAIRLLERIGED